MKKKWVGIDIGGTKTLFVIADANGSVYYSERYPTDKDSNCLPDAVYEFIDNSGISREDIGAVGIGVCGIADVEKGIVRAAPAVGWFDVNLRELLRSRIPWPVYVENDVNCCAMGELECGLLKGCGNAVYIAIGTGIGGAIVINGDIYRGSAFCAGEVGMTLCKHDIKDGGPVRIENKVSGLAINTRASAYGLTSRELFAAYMSEGLDTGGLIADFITEISVLTANCVCLLNPERIVIGGGVAQSMHCVIDDIRRLTAAYAPARTEIYLSGFANEAAAIGAAMFAYHSECGKII
jgi:glucokinase